MRVTTGEGGGVGGGASSRGGGGTSRSRGGEAGAGGQVGQQPTYILFLTAVTIGKFMSAVL